MADEKKDDVLKRVGQSLQEKRENAAEAVKKGLAEHAGSEQIVSYRVRAMLYMAALGFTHKEISAQLGVTTSRVSTVLSSPSAKKEIERFQYELFIQDPQKMFMQILPKAVRTAKNIMLNKKTRDNVKADVAFKFMDRALGKPKETVQHEGSGIREILIALDKQNSGVHEKTEIVEAEFKEIEKESEKKENKDNMDAWLDEHL